MNFVASSIFSFSAIEIVYIVCIVYIVYIGITRETFPLFVLILDAKASIIEKWMTLPFFVLLDRSFVLVLEGVGEARNGWNGTA